MKSRIGLFLAVLLLGTAGCSNVPSPYSQQLKAASKSHSSIRRGYLLSELEVQLGPSRGKDAEGALVWETRFDPLIYAVLKVWFDGENRATRIKTTHSRGIDVPGYHSSLVTSFEK